jgi:hypothetical protein
MRQSELFPPSSPGVSSTTLFLFQGQILDKHHAFNRIVLYPLRALVTHLYSYQECPFFFEFLQGQPWHWALCRHVPWILQTIGHEDGGHEDRCTPGGRGALCNNKM